jgi:5-(carboxyamino)imidazole ribonucleotide synthase
VKIGIIGAGQLGRMLALAGYPLGLRFAFLDRGADTPGGRLGQMVDGAFDDAAKLAALAREVDVITFDVENVPVEAVGAIAALKPFWPPVAALGASQDRLHEKTLFRKLRIPTPAFAPIDSPGELEKAVATIGLPGVLKTRRLGYDGRGQYYLRQPADIAPAWETLGSVPLIYEQFVSFSREVSIIGVRSTRGEMRCYPLSSNAHSAGILRYTVAPYRHAALQRQAETHLRRLMRHFDYAGVLTIEFFVKGGKLIANEMAPRVHNSGHWTIEGAETSQFENHLRGILGLPLGGTQAVSHCAMVNFIGSMPDCATVLRIPGVHFHSYDKEPRPNRKLGHCTVTAASAATRDKLLKRLLELKGE